MQKYLRYFYIYYFPSPPILAELYFSLFVLALCLLFFKFTSYFILCIFLPLFILNYWLLNYYKINLTIQKYIKPNLGGAFEIAESYCGDENDEMLEIHKDYFYNLFFTQILTFVIRLQLFFNQYPLYNYVINLLIFHNIILKASIYVLIITMIYIISRVITFAEYPNYNFLKLSVTMQEKNLINPKIRIKPTKETCKIMFHIIYEFFVLLDYQEYKKFKTRNPSDIFYNYKLKVVRDFQLTGDLTINLPFDLSIDTVDITKCYQII